MYKEEFVPHRDSDYQCFAFQLVLSSYTLFGI
jgi:hypothetical protein